MFGSYKGNKPKIHSSVFVAKNADIIGDVTIDKDANIWFKTVSKLHRIFKY